MGKVEIIVGSMLGASEDVADQLAETLQLEDIDSNITIDTKLEQLNPSDFWIICSSTHGAGELPDNIIPFSEQLALTPDLKQLKFLVVALGDSNYDTFCQAGLTLEQQLKDCGATNVSDVLTIDVSEHALPEEVAQPWLTQHISKIKTVIG